MHHGTATWSITDLESRFNITSSEPVLQQILPQALTLMGVSPGEATVRLRLEPPADHVWNADAPHHMEVKADDLLTVGDVPPADHLWDIGFPINSSGEGTTNLRFRVMAYFCEEDIPEYCRFAAAELVLPVTVTEEGSPKAEATHRTVIE